MRSTARRRGAHVRTRGAPSWIPHHRLPRRAGCGVDGLCSLLPMAGRTGRCRGPPRGHLRALTRLFNRHSARTRCSCGVRWHAPCTAQSVEALPCVARLGRVARGRHPKGGLASVGGWAGIAARHSRTSDHQAVFDHTGRVFVTEYTRQDPLEGAHQYARFCHSTCLTQVL